MSNVDFNTPVWQLTIGQLVDILNSTSRQGDVVEQTEVREFDGDNYVRGLSGLASFLGCSKDHVSKLKSKGVFEGGFVQNGRKIVFDKAKCLKLFNDR